VGDGMKEGGEGRNTIIIRKKCIPISPYFIQALLCLPKCLLFPKYSIYSVPTYLSPPSDSVREKKTTRKWFGDIYCERVVEDKENILSFAFWHDMIIAARTQRVLPISLNIYQYIKNIYTIPFAIISSSTIYIPLSL